MKTKLAVISGGSSGLGFSIAKQLVLNNYPVAILGRNKMKLNNALNTLNADFSSKVIIEECNISNEEEVETVISRLSNNYEISHLFNNAGVGFFGKPEDNKSNLIKEVFSANVDGMILLTSALLRNTSAEKGAVIINILSTSALTGRANESLYCAAKWAARGYTESLKAYTKGTNFKVIAVYPGGMKTPFWNKIPNSGFESFMNPDDVAKKIVEAAFSIDSALISDIHINRIL